MAQIIKNNITICSNCNEPLVWTFMVAYNEWFCVHCKSSFPMLGQDRKDWTQKLWDRFEENLKLFKKLTAYYIPPTIYRVNCDKCELGGEYHINHVSKRLLTMSNNAKKKLFKK